MAFHVRFEYFNKLTEPRCLWMAHYAWIALNLFPVRCHFGQPDSNHCYWVAVLYSISCWLGSSRFSAFKLARVQPQTVRGGKDVFRNARAWIREAVDPLDATPRLAWLVRSCSVTSPGLYAEQPAAVGLTLLKQAHGRGEFSGDATDSRRRSAGSAVPVATPL